MAECACQQSGANIGFSSAVAVLRLNLHFRRTDDISALPGVGKTALGFTLLPL